VHLRMRLNQRKSIGNGAFKKHWIGPISIHTRTSRNMLTFKQFCLLLDEEDKTTQANKEQDQEKRKKKIKKLLSKDDHWKGLT